MGVLCILMTIDNKIVEKRSNWWYILPILLGWIGGIIGYFVVRHDDPTLAKRVLILGIIISVAYIAISVITSGVGR